MAFRGLTPGQEALRREPTSDDRNPGKVHLNRADKCRHIDSHHRRIPLAGLSTLKSPGDDFRTLVIIRGGPRHNFIEVTPTTATNFRDRIERALLRTWRRDAAVVASNGHARSPEN